MLEAYRVVARRPRVVIAGRLWLTAIPAILALLVATFGLSFSTVWQLTLSCHRVARDPELTLECSVTRAGVWERFTERFVLISPKHARVEDSGARRRVVVPTARGDVVLLSSAFGQDELTRLAAETLESASMWNVHGFSHAGALIFDLRVLLPSGVLTTMLLLLSLRRRRIEVDELRQRVIATTTLLRWRTARVPLRRGDRVTTDESHGKHRLLLVGGGGARVLLDSDGGHEEMERLAQRLASTLEAR